MRLRTQILVFLLLFGLAPLLLAFAINIPLVFNSLELFYHKAHLQNLRADFRDLDQHIASRVEMVRLLAKLPDGEQLIADPSRIDPGVRQRIEQRFVDSVNRILYDQRDIVQVLFMDREGKPGYWLERNPATRRLEPEPTLLDLPQTAFFEAGLRLEAGGVLISPISVNPEAGARDPTRFMVLRLISPLAGLQAGAQGSPALPPGVAVIDIDVGGLAEAYPKTYWVLSDGSFLRYGGTAGPQSAAFTEFPGLEEIFRKGELALWKGAGNEQVIWVPLLSTERSGPLWVGRQVDASPLAQFRDALQVRVGAIVLPFIALILLLARWFAGRAERYGRELTDGIAGVLQTGEPVRFAPQGPQELQALATNLTRLAETHAANSEALRQHARELEESNRYKSEFLANVSHELRTPLNSILLLSKLLAESCGKDLSAEQGRQARVIHDAGQDLSGLIDNILDLARIEARRATVNLEETHLPTLLEALLDLVRPQTDAKGLGLQLDIEPGAPATVVTDPDKLRQIIKNFLGNAVKFTDHGGIRVALTTSAAEDAAARPARILVADTGIGIPEDKHEIIFEAFKQADGSTSRRYGGSGLGLAISRGLADLLGARITLQSEVGKGSRFCLLLPLEPERSGLDVEPTPPQARGAPGRVVALPSADFGGRRVLLVDDDVRDLLAITPLLERWKLTVLAAGDGQEAMEVLRDEPVDVVIMDIMLPGRDGNDMIKQIKADTRFRELPVVALTARTDPETRARTLAAGASELLGKPVNPQELRDALARALPTEPADQPREPA